MREPSVRFIRGTARWLGLAVRPGICFSAASMGARFPPGRWYAGLDKPSWNPPGWAFGPVRSALYATMRDAAGRVGQRGGVVAERRAWDWFAVQLALNAVWTPLGFGWRLPAVAFEEFLLPCAAIAAAPNLAIWRLKP